MKKNISKIIFVLFSVLIMISGCSGNKDAEIAKKELEKQQQEEQQIVIEKEKKKTEITEKEEEQNEEIVLDNSKILSEFDSSFISSDPLSGQFALNNILITIPFNESLLTEIGFEVNEKDMKAIDSYENELSFVYKATDKVNPSTGKDYTEEEIQKLDKQIRKIIISSEKLNFQMKDGICVGSTYQEVLDSFGEPFEAIEKNDQVKSLVYTDEFFINLVFNFNTTGDNPIVSTITLEEIEY